MANFSYSTNYLGIADVFLRTPTFYKPILEFLEIVMVGDSELTREEREIIASHVSNVNGCKFCLEAHKATLAAMGVGNVTIATLENGPSIQGITKQLQQLIIFSDKLTRTPAAISSTEINYLKQQGISEQTIEDTINVVAIFNYVNRLVDAFGVSGSPDYFKHVGRALAKNGYVKLLQRYAML